MPGKGAGIVFRAESRTERNVSTPLNDRSQKNRQFRWTVAVVAIEKNNHIRILCIRYTRQTSASISAARFFNNARPHPSGDVGCSIRRVAVDNDDLDDEIRMQIREHAANSL